ncbi:MAG: hypothetical protein V4478_02975 [Patescibacteria group bacterium]
MKKIVLLAAVMLSMAVPTFAQQAAGQKNIPNIFVLRATDPQGGSYALEFTKIFITMKKDSTTAYVKLGWNEIVPNINYQVKSIQVKSADQRFAAMKLSRPSYFGGFKRYRTEGDYNFDIPSKNIAEYVVYVEFKNGTVQQKRFTIDAASATLWEYPRAASGNDIAVVK